MINMLHVPLFDIQNIPRALYNQLMFHVGKCGTLIFISHAVWNCFKMLRLRWTQRYQWPHCRKKTTQFPHMFAANDMTYIRSVCRWDIWYFDNFLHHLTNALPGAIRWIDIMIRIRRNFVNFAVGTIWSTYVLREPKHGQICFLVCKMFHLNIIYLQFWILKPNTLWIS